MTKPTVAAYLKHDSKTLGNLLAKFNQLKIWNSYLHECLPQEQILLEHCRIVGLDKTSLIVIANSPHWVTRFRFFIPELLIQLRCYTGLQNIKSICCKVRPSYYPAIKKQKRPPLNISPQTAEALQDIASKLPDGKLKRALTKMAERK